MTYFKGRSASTTTRHGPQVCDHGKNQLNNYFRSAKAAYIDCAGRIVTNLRVDKSTVVTARFFEMKHGMGGNEVFYRIKNTQII